MRWAHSLRLRFTIATTILLAIFIFVTALFSLTHAISQEKSRILRDAQNNASLAVPSIVQTYDTYHGTIGLKLATSMKPLADKLPYVEYFQVIDLHGKVVYDSQTLKHSVIETTYTDDDSLKAITSFQPTINLSSNPPVAFYPAFDSASTHTYTVRYVFTLSDLHHFKTDAITQAILVAAIGIPVIFFVMGYLTQLWIVNPINQIRADANIVSGGKYDHAITVKSRDEFRQMAQNINTLVDTLAAQVQDLQEEKQWKDEFITLASHNLRTPITVIMTAVNSLKKEKLSPEGKKLVEYIASRGKELHGLTENLLSISLLKGEKLKLAQEPFDLMAVIQNVVKDHELRLKERKMELVVKAKDGQVIVNGSEGQIFQVVDNLVDNAIKFSGDGSTVTVEVDPTPQDVTVKVIDSGQGIDEEVVSKLFQSFHRGSDPISMEHHGAGLGLYYVKLAVEAHGGEVSIKSHQGKGTEVIFRLPRQVA